MTRNNDREARAGRGVAVFETREAPWLEDLETATLLKFLRDFDRYHRDLMVQVPRGGEQAVPFRMVDCVDLDLLDTICQYGFPEASDYVDEEDDDYLPEPRNIDSITDEQLRRFIRRETELPYNMQTEVIRVEEISKKYLVYDMNKPVRARVFGLFKSFGEMVSRENLDSRFEGKSRKKIGKILSNALVPLP